MLLSRELVCVLNNTTCIVFAVQILNPHQPHQSTPHHPNIKRIFHFHFELVRSSYLCASLLLAVTHVGTFCEKDVEKECSVR